MRRYLIYRLLMVAAAVVIAVGALLLSQIWIREKPACVLDPADLPGSPTGPEGRPANYIHTCGSDLYDVQGHKVRIAGINWSGIEDGNYTPGGLGVRKWQDILDQVAALGYNTLRLPFSNEALEPKRKIGGANFATNPDLQDLNGLGMIDRIVAGARERGLKVILDRHRTTPSRWGPLWYDEEVSRERWIDDWRMLAARYYGNDTVIGVDLHNEPRNPTTWGTGDPGTDWRMAAERAGNAIQEVNPYLLIFVEGIESYKGNHYWWGGNLMGVRTAPVRLRVPNRVVYSPHDYGPNIAAQSWFYDPSFPRNLPSVWDKYWGYIQKEGIAPVVVGEFGGRSVGNDREGQWQRTLIDYLRSRSISALVWSLNPGWDTGGVFEGDWQTIDQEKQKAYQQILAAPLDTGPLGIFGRAPTRLKVLFRQGHGVQSDRLSFVFRIVNDGPETLDLSRLELRYWFKGGNEIDLRQPGAFGLSYSGTSRILVDFVPTNAGDQDHYIRVRFSANAGKLGRYQVSDEIGVQTPEIGPPNSSRAGDHSFATIPDLREHFGEWDRVTLYLDGQLVWGQEP